MNVLWTPLFLMAYTKFKLLELSRNRIINRIVFVRSQSLHIWRQKKIIK